MPGGERDPETRAPRGLWAARWTAGAWGGSEWAGPAQIGASFGDAGVVPRGDLLGHARRLLRGERPEGGRRRAAVSTAPSGGQHRREVAPGRAASGVGGPGTVVALPESAENHRRGCVRRRTFRARRFSRAGRPARRQAPGPSSGTFSWKTWSILFPRGACRAAFEGCVGPASLAPRTPPASLLGLSLHLLGNGKGSCRCY